MYQRLLENTVLKKLQDNKAIILIGPRQTGKTTLLENIAEKSGHDYLFLSGDDADIRTKLENASVAKIKNLIGPNKLIFIDEAQRITNVGLCLKLITDQLKGIKVIASGSSAFELANKINEPLTGRKWEYMLYPISFSEMCLHHGEDEEKRALHSRLVYGYYPDILNHPGEEIPLLKQLANSYLYKDLLTWERIQKPDRMERLVQALAFQIGNEVSYHEIGQICGLNNETVEHYINLLEKAFIIFRLYALTRNHRNELKKSRKVYFYDNGLRNAIINQFNPIGLRADEGALWENFMVSERMKHNSYTNFFCNRYFWRTTSQQEIDYIEEQNEKMFAFEFKWNVKTKARFPRAFINAYPGTSAQIITPDNYTEFVK